MATASQKEGEEEGVPIRAPPLAYLRVLEQEGAERRDWPVTSEGA